MASIPKPMSADEKRWQAESDAGALKRYAEINMDPKRKQAAEAMIKDEIKKSQVALGQSTKPAEKVTKPAKSKAPVKTPVKKVVKK